MRWRNRLDCKQFSFDIYAHLIFGCFSFEKIIPLSFWTIWKVCGREFSFSLFYNVWNRLRSMLNYQPRLSVNSFIIRQTVFSFSLDWCSLIFALTLSISPLFVVVNSILESRVECEVLELEKKYNGEGEKKW